MKRSLVAGSAALMLPCAVFGQVELRDGKGRAESPVAAVGLEGVRVTTEVSGKKQEQLIGWDWVKRVEGEHGPQADALAELADHAWRARVRVERGDFAAAEPLFEQVFATLSGHDGPTAAMAAEGLLRCRLARGAQAAAVWPWLEWVGVMERSGGLVGSSGAGGPGVTNERSRWLGGGIAAPPVINEASGIVPALPPVWLSGPSVAALGSAGEWVRYTAGGLVGSDISALYEQAARFEAGQESKVPALAHEPKTDPALGLVRDMVAARIGDAAERKIARDSLRSRMTPVAPGGKGKPAPPARWTEAWCRVGIGRSLLRESDESQRVQGVIELLHLPARFAHDEPYLAQVALAESAVALQDLQDPVGASVLKAELREKFPSCAPLEWEPLKKVKDQGPGEKARSGQSAVLVRPAWRGTHKEHS